MKIPNTLIRASAGSGKTFQLTNRFIQLLVADVAPEKVIALTFTKKAAGEFFEGILTKLAKASSSADEAKCLAKELAHGVDELPPLGYADFAAALRRLVDSMPQLALGTIDSFFHRMLGLFPFEFGLGGEFEIMSEFERSRVRSDVLERLFESKQANRGAHDAIIESHRLASAGRDKRSLVAELATHLKDCHELFIRKPAGEYWGDPVRIWPHGNPWVKSKANLEKLMDDLEVELNRHDDFTDAIVKAWQSIVDHLRTWAPGKKICSGSSPSAILQQALDSLTTLGDGGWEFSYYKKPYKVSDLFARLLSEVLCHFVACELELKFVRTKGIHSLLDLFESHYDEQIRRTGRLTFSDFPMLLAPGEDRPSLGGRGPSRLDIEYRLDGQFDHWLLDEFQDTSRMQWRVFENLIDEVVQDPEGQRTLFCVGDPKQSIYQWRGGDPTLFDRLESRYQAGSTEEFSVCSLDQSWRSCSEVLSLVNAVFGDAGILAEYDEFGAGVSRWNEIWKPHASAKSDETGHAMYLTVESKEDRWRLVAELLREIQPLENRLSCAVIVQKNDVVREVVNFLRGELPGLPVVGESASNPGADNPLGAALLTLFKAAAHPGDRYSDGHLMLTPFGETLPAEWSERQEALRSIQCEIYAKGFALVASDWTEKISDKLDEFGQWRAAQFLDMARQFDETGLRDIDEFTRFIPEQELNDSNGEGAVQVMTVHKAKGLTFDATIVPDLESNRLDETRRDALHVRKTSDGELDWILDMPGKEIYGVDDPLLQAKNESRSDSCYENLCRLYVALTRASHGLYVVTEKPKKNSSSRNYTRLLTDTLAKGEGEKFGKGNTKAEVVFEEGSFGWIKPKPTSELGRENEIGNVSAKRVHPHLAKRRPSSHETAGFSADRLFDESLDQALSHGESVHKVFEQIDWVDETSLAKLETLRSEYPEAVAEVENCLSNETLAKRLAKPEAGAQLWRERMFDVVIEGEIVSGVFDRVHLFTDRAEIIDFKTDKSGEDSAEIYRPQMQLYRQALAKLTGLSEETIRCHLLFTHDQSIVESCL